MVGCRQNSATVTDRTNFSNIRVWPVALVFGTLTAGELTTFESEMLAELGDLYAIGGVSNEFVAEFA